MNFTPYAPRPLKSLGVIELRGYRLKAYSILYGSAPLDRAAFDAGLALAQRELPTPAVAPGRPGLGFVIFHQGRSGPYLILAWWDNENELPVRVFLADPPPNGEVAAATGRPASAPAWRPAAATESFCVWDLRVLWHEREAYVAAMLAGQADPAAYLAATIEGEA